MNSAWNPSKRNNYLSSKARKYQKQLMINQAEVRSAGLLAISYDISSFVAVPPNRAVESNSLTLRYAPLNPPPTRRILPIEYGISIDRSGVTQLLLERGFTEERISRASLHIAEYDRTADPFVNGKIYSRYDPKADKINIFTGPLYSARPSPTPTEALMHGVYHSTEGDIEPSKLGQTIQRFGMIFFTAPMIAGGVAAYALSYEEPNLVSLLVAAGGVLLGCASGLTAADAPMLLSSSQRDARRFVKERLRDPLYKDIIAFRSPSRIANG